MSLLLRIAFAVIIGVLVTAVLHWLVPKIPYGIDVLLGIVAAFIAYGSYPGMPKDR